MALDLSSLKKAIDSFGRTLNAACSSKKMAALDKDQKDAIRAGVIQNFEVTYELCWKFIQRWLRENRSVDDADHSRSRKELFRMAARFGLIADPEVWFEYGEARNLTAHTYDEKRAVEVFEVAVRFVDDAKYLLNKLEKNND